MQVSRQWDFNARARVCKIRSDGPIKLPGQYIHLEMDRIKPAMDRLSQQKPLGGRTIVMKKERKTRKAVGDFAQSPEDQSAGDQTEVPQPRPFSTRDYVYECVNRAPIEDFAGSSTGHPMNVGERDLTLKAMVASIQTELETLKAEAYQQGELAALESLHSIAYESTRQLFLLTQYAPDLVSRIAEYEPVWPLLYSNAAVAKKAAANVIEVIKLGTKRSGRAEINPGRENRADGS